MKATKRQVITSAIAISEAIKTFGSERALARRFKINRQSIYYWRHRALLPCDIALKICAATKGKVQLCKLRPDLGLELKELEQIILKKYQQNGDNHDVVPIKP